MRGENTNHNDTFVVDTSFVLAYLMPDEKERNVDEMFSKFEANKVRFVAPSLLVYEIMNGLRSAVLQKRQDPTEAELLLNSFLEIGILLEKVDEKDVLRLSLEKNISAYDATYVWLAKHLGLKLLTLDERLENALK